MEAAAYASVLNLLRILDNIQHPSRLRLLPDPKQIDALREKLSILQDFLELHSSTMTDDIEFTVRKISRVIYDVELLIDKFMVDQLYRESYPQNNVVRCNTEYFGIEINLVIQEIESINEALTKLMSTQSPHDQEQPRVLDKNAGEKTQSNDHSLITSTGEKNKMVGFDDQLMQVLEKLTGSQQGLVIVPIVGMGGIGKTTLARSLFDHPYNLHHFYIRIWLTISQDYSVKNVLQGLLNDGVLDDHEKDRELGCEREDELITLLHKKLFGQRYLIVLDDVWSTEAWDDLRRGFPDNGIGSRVMLTTRLHDIAKSLDSQNNNTYSMKFLDEDKSWDLFSEKAFEKGGKSRVLEQIGREISKRCKGLPLLLLVLGGLLANSNMTVEYWLTVKENICSFANSANDEYCLRILSLSYNHLPIHLKPCFLYVRHLKEDSEVKVSEFIEKWVSLGFVKPMKEKSLEEAARKYLEDLVGRSLFLVLRKGKTGNIKICGVHDLLRDLSIKEFNKEKLLEVPKIYRVYSYICENDCVICNTREIETTIFYSDIIDSKSYGKHLVCSSCESKFLETVKSRFVVAVNNGCQNIPMLTTYRWIDWDTTRIISIFHTLRLFWNLEFLRIENFLVVLPKELWEMPQLRRVKVSSFTLPYPVSTTNDVLVLENLQTFTMVKQFKLMEEIVRRIPNLRKLGLRYSRFPTEGEEEDWSCYYLQNLAHLQKLESLYLFCNTMVPIVLKKVIVFPHSLKKLTLQHCRIAWDDLTIIGSLPNLQVLKLLYNSVSGEEWNPIQGELLFPRLKYLELRRLNLVRWRINETHFPDLETLFLDQMNRLMEIPREIGELPSLKLICLDKCVERLINSAKAIVEEQLSYGNKRLSVRFLG